MSEKLYQTIAQLVQARENCKKSNNREWLDKHESRITDLVKSFLPSGSGFDNGTQIDLDESTPNRLVFHTAYHHMNDGGYYDGWTEHSVIVTPDLASGFDLRITGRDRREIKDYIGEVFHHALSVDTSEQSVTP